MNRISHLQDFQPAPDRSGGQLPAYDHDAPPIEATVHEAPQASSGPAELSSSQWAAANARRLLLVQAKPLLDSGVPDCHVAQSLGVSAATLCRLLNLCPSKDSGILNSAGKCRRLLDLPTEKLAPPVAQRAGSEFDVLLQVKEITDEMVRLYVATMGASCAQMTNDRRTGSMATTLKRLGDFPAVPPLLAAKLRAGAQPKPLVEFLKRTFTPEIEAKVRGQKHYATATISGRRDLVEELEDGTRVPLQPGRVWVFDDMSSNIPFWFDVDRAELEGISDHGLRQLVERHGCALGRQGLYAWDWASGMWLAVELVGRLRDAYQAADILRFLRKLVMLYGKPEKIVFERGVWAARAISGWAVREDELVETEDSWQVPEMAGDESAKLNDGIRALGIVLIQTHTPRGKPIEGAFNHHQRLVPTFFNRGEVVNIGRHAGEFEWSARAYRRGQAGVLHPRDLGFVHIDRLAEVIWEAMVWEGNQPKARRDGKPIEIFSTWLQTSPLQPASQQDLAVFLPHKGELLIRGGVISPLGHQFLAPEQFAALGDGSRVGYAFDPAEPTLGAAIYTERGFLCWADFLPAGPVISARPRGDAEGPQLLKRYKAAHRNAFRALDIKSLRPVAIAERRNGSGAAVTVGNTDLSARTQAAPAPQAPRRTAEHPETVRNRLSRSALSALAGVTD